jgi:hypothetical protein
MTLALVHRRLIEIRLAGEKWPLDDKGRHTRQMPRAQRRNLKSLRIGPEPIQPATFVHRHEPVRRTAPDPMNEPTAAPPVLTDELALCFPGRQLSPLDNLPHDDLFMSEPAEFESCYGTSDWVFPGYQDDPSMQTGATFWSL